LSALNYWLTDASWKLGIRTLLVDAESAGPFPLQGGRDLPYKQPKGEGVRSGRRSTTEAGLVPDRAYLEGYLGLLIQGLIDAGGPVAQRDRGL